MSEGITELAHRRGTRHPVVVVTLLVVVLLVAVTGGSYLAWRSRQPGPVTFCAPNLLVSTPTASTPRLAFERWLAGDPGQPPLAEWHQDSATSFTNRSYEHPGGRGYYSVEVKKGPDPGVVDIPADQWNVRDACS